MIAFFVYDLDRYSGAAKQALLLARNMSRKVLIFNLNFSRYRRWRIGENIEVINLPKSLIFQFLSILFHTIGKNIRTYHCHGFFLSTLLVGKMLNRKIILKTTLLGDDDLDTLRKSSFGALKLKFLQCIKVNVVLSEKLKNINTKYLKKPEITLIPNGTFIPRNDEIKKKQNIFCYVGLICPRKRPLESIIHFKRNFSKIPESCLYMVENLSR
ncbi:MAG: hypothetical protein ACLFQB_10090 [Chitinispirillaceae bacterium]